MYAHFHTRDWRCGLVGNAEPLPTEPVKVRRRTAEERREDVIAAAIVEFATLGLHGASTETIAARAGISQPYVLRLFGTKKALFLAAVDRVCQQIVAAWEDENARLAPDIDRMSSQEHLLALGERYFALVEEVDGLRLCLQSFASAEDSEVRALVHDWQRRMYAWIRDTTGADGHSVQRFFAFGMMLTVAASIDAIGVADREAWARSFLMYPVE